MSTAIKKGIQRVLGKFGLTIRSTSHSPPNRLSEALLLFNIDTLLDVGANTGQFAFRIRKSGFEGRIVSFEPLSKEHEYLVKRAKKDSNWTIHSRGALGDVNGKASINISRNSMSSSLLDINKSHLDAAQGSDYIGSENIVTQTLDSIVDQYLSSDNKTFLKIDAQGFESQILDGATNTLPEIQGVLLETSFTELYKGQVLWRDLIDRLEKEGFTIWSIERGFTDQRNGRLMQCDVIFFRL